MNEHEFLKKFQQVLTDEKYDCSLIEISEGVPYERLLVFIGMDEKNREKILEVTALKQELFQDLEGKKHKKSGPAFYRIQFQMPFLFSVKPTVGAQVSSLVCYLNRLIELPGFDLDEINLKLSYRYVLLYGEEGFNKKLFTSIVGLVMLQTELFASSLEKVATGEITFNQLLEQIIEISKLMQK